jgi:DNA-binding response OmpR family regulator
MTDRAGLGPVARRLAATERVLCIEDEHDIAAFLRAYFRAAGYDFVHIDPSTAADAVAAVEEHHPDLVLLDLRLRGFSGMDIYRDLRAREAWAFTPIIIVSAHAASDANFVEPTGIDGFLAKPFNTNTLAGLVKERIADARSLYVRGHDDTYQLMSQEYLAARIRDEITVNKTPFAFALVQLTTMEVVASEVGVSGRQFVIAHLLTEARERLADDVVLGATGTDELAVLMPGRNSETGRAELEPVMAAMSGTFQFPGGAEVPVGLAGGLASFPANGTDVDPLFMAADLALADALDAGELLRVAT